MKTKQLRLSSVDEIKSRIGNLLGKKINIVFTDNTVMMGELSAVHVTEIELLNMRLKKIRYPLSTIAEIYFDTYA